MNMNKLKIILLTCATAGALAACSTPTPTAVIGFNYDIDNGKANGIVQVFDLNGNTVVQVRDLNPKTTHFLDGKNGTIPFKVVGQNVVLTGMHSTFTVSTAAAASRVVRKTDAPGTLPTMAATSTAATPTAAKQFSALDSDAAIIAEIARMRKELAELKAVLAAAREVTPSAQDVVVAQTGQDGTHDPSVVIVSFPNNSRQFAPVHEQRTQLLALSRTSQSISVRGFTDSDFPTPGSAALARARAEAAKRYLVSMGVSPAKIVVGFTGAGEFIADNSSPAGRAANRRVEIGGT